MELEHRRVRKTCYFNLSVTCSAEDYKMIKLYYNTVVLVSSIRHVLLGCIAGDLRYKEYDGTCVDCKDKTSVCIFCLFVFAV